MAGSRPSQTIPQRRQSALIPDLQARNDERLLRAAAPVRLAVATSDRSENCREVSLGRTETLGFSR